MIIFLAFKYFKYFKYVSIDKEMKKFKMQIKNKIYLKNLQQVFKTEFIPAHKNI